MNNNIENAYQNALLSNAAYIDLKGDFVDNKEIQEEAWGKFKESGFTREQFDEFVDRYHVDFHESDKTSGFSATVFIDTDNHDKKTIAFRGTEFGDGNYDFGDLFQDLQLVTGFSGLFKLIGDAVNRITFVDELRNKGLTAAADFLEIINVPSMLSQLNDLEDFMLESGLVDESGLSVNPAETVNFVGHSLGGHLALQATDNYIDLGYKTTTFNGAGMALFDDWIFQNHKIQPGQVTNYYATPGWEVTAGQGLEELSLFGRQGTRQGLFIESQGSTYQLGNHSMYHIVNSLSVMRLLEAADPSVELVSANQYLHAATNLKVETTNDDGTSGGDSPAETLDTVMTHLANFLGGRYQGLTTTNDAENFYSLLTGEDGLAGQFKIVATPTAEGSYDSLKETHGFEGTSAYLYSLLELSPFLVIPPEGYGDGVFAFEDTPYQDVTEDRYSENFIKDRAEFFALVMNRNSQDTEAGKAVGDGDVFYTDHYSADRPKLEVFGESAGNKTSSKQIIFGSHQNDQVDDLTGSEKDDRIYGLDGNDKLKGNDGDDTLEGGHGDDDLTGGLGNDVLSGGTGIDSYIYDSGDGHDRIEEVEGDKSDLGSVHSKCG